MTLQDYLDAYNLWDIEKLGEFCQDNSVYLKTSDKYPGLVLLHYMDEASYGRSWNEFNVMCRGAILDMRTKKVIAWPFNKFFNLGEHTSTYEEVMSKGDFVATEKLDGSMLILFPYNGKNYLTTKGSFDSDHGERANEIMPRGMESWNLDGHTYMFELIDSKFRNVIDYKKRGYADGIYLIGIRYPNSTLASSSYLTDLAERLGLNAYKTFKMADLKYVVSECETLPSTEEGYVLKFDNEQFLVKVKGKDYLIAHKVMKGMNDTAVIEALEQGKADELVMYCPEEYRDEVGSRFNFFEELTESLMISISEIFKPIHLVASYDRKTFATMVNASVDKEYRKFMFKLLDGLTTEEFKKMVYSFIRQNKIKDGVYHG